MSSGHYCDGCAQAYYKCVCNKPQEKVKEQTIKMSERIKELALQAGVYSGGMEWTIEESKTFICTHKAIERFAALVEAAAHTDEREACAKLCEGHVRQPSRLHFAEAIRARGTT